MPLALTGYEIGLLTSALVFIAFALVVAMVIPRARPEFPSKYLGWFIAACIVLFAVQLTAVVLLAEVGEAHEEEVAQESEPGETETTPTETTETTEASGDPVAGKDVFASAGCVSCHTLADAGATGTIGPNLDATSPPYELVVERVTNGLGVMPSFEDSLPEQQIQDVAAYVSTAAGG